MFTSFSTALSALSAHSTAVDVVGNNLANLNTPGFKASVVAFHDLVTQSLGTGLGETQVGFGVGRPITLRQFSQGAIQASSGPLDAAIQGDGFLVVKDRANVTLYTRGGNLQVDKEGNLLTATGERVQGWTESGGVLDINGVPGDIVIPVAKPKEPITTSHMSVDLNLDAGGTVGPPPTEFSTSIEVFDSLGAAHVLSVKFTKTAPNTWHATVTVPGADVGSADASVTLAETDLTFGGDGKLTSPAAPGEVPVALTGLVSGATDLNLTWDLFNATTPRVTQYAQPSAVSANAQNGSPASQLIRVALADGGKILAQYSNGQQMEVGRLAMASVRNPESMVAVGNNAFQLSARTALPAIGIAGTGGRGTILGGAIEFSTVDIAREFTNLIVLQRGYQANSRVITTVDQLSEETINLKR